MAQDDAGQEQLPCRVRGEWSGDRLLIVVEGELDLSTFPVLDEQLRAHADEPLSLDLGGVGFIDSSGLAALVLAKRRADERGLPFGIARTSEAVRLAMDVSGVADQFG